MRNLVLLTILILLAGAGYIGFSVLTFEPDIPQHYSLSLKTLGNTLDADNDDQGALSNQNEKIKDEIIVLLKGGISKYDKNWVNPPVQVTTISSTLTTSIKKGVLPVFYPTSNFSSSNLSSVQSYKPLIPVSPMIEQVSETLGEAVISEVRCSDPTSGFILGDTGDNMLACDQPTRTDVRFYMSGPGNDTIDARGNAIIDGGAGNDKIKSGPELTLIYVEPNFGLDSIQMSCDHSKISLTDQNMLDILPWNYEFVHFIIFDPRISKKDVSIIDNKIKHNVTGDQIVMNQNCFNIVFLSDK